MAFQNIIDPRGHYPIARYSFDTSAFIEPSKYYPQDRFRSVWRDIGNLIQQGIILATYIVKEELAAKEDNLYHFVIQFPNLFVEPTPREHIVVRRLVNHVRLRVWGAGDSKKNRADPFVVALATVHNLKVVTYEKSKIPFACQLLEIDCISFIEFLRRENLQY